MGEPSSGYLGQVHHVDPGEVVGRRCWIPPHTCTYLLPVSPILGRCRELTLACYFSPACPFHS